MKANVINQTDQPRYDYYRRFLGLALKRTKEVLKLEKEIECSLILVLDESIQKINKDYRNKDVPTDVISFASLEGEMLETSSEHYVGDIFINMQAMERQAKEYGHSRKREFSFLFVHGLLHCLGYDHQDPSSEASMLSVQKEILDGIATRRSTQV